MKVKLSSALICLDMGKGNEKLNLSKDMFMSASKKKHCCVNPVALSVFLDLFRARRRLKGSTAGRQWKGGGIKRCCTAAKRGAGWEC